MVYKVPRPAAENPENCFEFQFDEDGPVYSIPYLQYIPAEALDFLESNSRITMGDTGFTKELIRLCDEDAGKSLHGLHRDQIKGIADAWAEESKVSAGESLASENS